MAKKLEQFREESKASPKGELKIKVPKAMRASAKSRVREIMKEDDGNQEKEALRRQHAALLEEIEGLKAQEAVFPKTAYETVILPILQTKEEEAATLLGKINAEKPKPDLREKREKIKKSLETEAEFINEETEKILTALPYYPEQAMAGAAEYLIGEMGGKEKPEEKFIDAYLGKEELPPVVLEALKLAEEKIKNGKLAVVARVRDAAVREKLERLVAETPVTKDELAREFSLDKDRRRNGFELNLAIVRLGVNEGVVSNHDLETIMSISMVAGLDATTYGGARQQSGAEKLIQWELKDEPRLRNLRYQAEIGRDREDRSTITTEGRKELEFLQKKAARLDSDRVGPRMTYKEGLEKTEASRRGLEKTKEVALKLAPFEKRMEELVGENWIAKLERDFEREFSAAIKRLEEIAEGLTREYAVEKEKLIRLNGRVEGLKMGTDAAALIDDRLEQKINETEEIEKQIAAQNKGLLGLKRRMEAVNSSLIQDCEEKLVSARGQELRSFVQELERVQIPEEAFGNDEFFAKAAKKKKDMLERAQWELKRETVSQTGPTRKHIEARSFYDNVKIEEKNRRVGEIIKPVRKIGEQIPTDVGTGRLSEGGRNAAHDLLNEWFFAIDRKRQELEAEDRQKKEEREAALRELERLKGERTRLDGKVLVIGKAGKLEELDGQIEVKRAEAGKLGEEMDRASGQIGKIDALKRLIQRNNI